MKNVVENYGWTTSKAPHSCGYIVPEVLNILSNLKVHRVCDLGSGNGALAYSLNEAGYYSAGVEHDQDGVSISRKNYPNINFYNYGVQDSPEFILKNEPLFDAVVSTEVIEHLFSPHLLPQFASKILRKGGYLVISTPYHGYLKNLALSVFNKWDKHHAALWHGGHIKFYSQKTLSQLLQENGFDVLGFSGAGRIPFLWKSMILVAKAV